MVPNVMANALRLHPLLVIFGLLAGGELYGIPGVLVALPTMAAARRLGVLLGARAAGEVGGRRGAGGRGGGRGAERPPPIVRRQRRMSSPRRADFTSRRAGDVALSP